MAVEVKNLLTSQTAVDLKTGAPSLAMVETIQRIVDAIGDTSALDALTARVAALEESALIGIAENEVLTTYGDTVSVSAKGKSLNKFGDNHTVGSAYETIMELQGTESNETYVSTNAIDYVVSSSGSDTQTITLEGHTIDASGNLTFTTQDVTLTGQTPAALTTPLARANRAFIKNSGTFNSPQAAFVGDMYVYDSSAAGGTTAGVPNTASATKLIIEATEVQTEKAATSISQSDYWFISYFSAAIGDAGASANFVTVTIEKRDVKNGGTWRPFGREIVLIPNATGKLFTFAPYLIVPPNHDVRARAKTDTNTAEVHAEFGGFLAAVQ